MSRVPRSYSGSIRGLVVQYIQQHGKRPTMLKIHPAVYDCWRAEMIATGKLAPWSAIKTWGGMRVLMTEHKERCSVTVE